MGSFPDLHSRSPCPCSSSHLSGWCVPLHRLCHEERSWQTPPCPLPFQVGFTSAPGQGGILAQREFDRRFSPHFVSPFPLVIEMRCSSCGCWRVCGRFGLHHSCQEDSAGGAVNPHPSPRASQKQQRVSTPAASGKELALWGVRVEHLTAVRLGCV